MNRLIVGWLCSAILCTMAAVCPVLAADTATDVKAMKSRLVELEEAIKDSTAKEAERRKAIREAPELVDLREAVDNASKEYREARGAYEAKVKELTEADQDLASAASKRVAATAEIKELQAKVLKATTDIIVQAGGSWKYLDDGSDPGAGWRAPEYDDAAWKAGPAPLGYGNGNEATTVESGPADAKHCMTCFRMTFDVKDASKLEGLILKLMRDDGAIVYLNGKEVVRDNMPEGEVTSQTLAAGSVGGAAEKAFHVHEIAKDGLVDGTNVLAVEVHQVNHTSSDVAFDLALLGKLVPSAWRPQ